MLFALGVIVIVLGVAVSIALHEIGHLLPAKLFNVRVSQYMIGFGPTLWSTQRGETEYGVKAIPLGGYIRMLGMFPPKEEGGKLREGTTGRWTQLIDEARAESLVEVGPEDEHRVFYKLSTPKKVLVMMGGPLMNLLIAAGLITALVTLHGVDTQQPGALVAAISTCQAKADGTAVTQCDAAGQAPAYKAGLRPNDIVTAINGVAIKTNTDVSAAVRPNAGKPLQVTYLRNGESHTVSVVPYSWTGPKLDAEGKPVTNAAGQTVTETYGLIGINSAPNYVSVPQPISAAPGYVWTGLSQTAGVFAQLPQKFGAAVAAAFGSGDRDPNGPISVVGVTRIGGEVAAADLPGNDDFGTKFAFEMQLIASLNLALFVFNLIPLLPLDGGHVAGALYEGARRRLARLRGRADPGHVDVAKGLPIAYAVASLLIVMSVLLIYADIVKPIQL